MLQKPWNNRSKCSENTESSKQTSVIDIKMAETQNNQVESVGNGQLLGLFSQQRGQCAFMREY